MLWLALVIVATLWLPLGLLAIFNFATTKRLEDLPLVEREDWPSVTILAPACNEARNIEEAIRSRVSLDYPNVRFLIINDRSTDATGEIADRLAAEDPRIQVLHNSSLPEGWLGKVHALDLGAKACTSEWILFSDADVVMKPSILRRAIQHCESRGFDVLAALPRLTTKSLGLRALYGVFTRILQVGLLTKAVESPRSSHGVGVGAFTLVRRKALLASEGFAALRLEVADDLVLGQILKRSGASCSFVYAPKAASVEMYADVWDFMRGAEKNSWAVSAKFSILRGLLASFLFLSLEISSLVLALFAPTPGLRLWGLALVLWMVALTMFALYANGQSPWFGLLYPIGACLFFFMNLRGCFLGWRNGGLQWRGTFYQNAVFRAFLAERKQKKKPA